MNIKGYLNRIDCRIAGKPTADTIRQIHRAHMLTVPFENLDIHLGHPIRLDIPSFYDKVVRRRRGGFCYELNGLFAWLLDQLGFKVTLLSVRVIGDSQEGPEFDHLLLLVESDRCLIADVGFGDLFLEPLRLEPGQEQRQSSGVFRLIDTGSEWALQRREGTHWEAKYVFSLKPHRLSEFSEMCHFHQTSPDSHFTQQAICSIARANGRVTLSNNRLIVNAGNKVEEQKVRDETAYRRLLKIHFGIELNDKERVDRLIALHGSSPHGA